MVSLNPNFPELLPGISFYEENDIKRDGQYFDVPRLHTTFLPLFPREYFVALILPSFTKEF